MHICKGREIFLVSTQYEDSAEDKYETSELLQPFDDLRFKTHSILPFNLVRY